MKIYSGRTYKISKPSSGLFKSNVTENENIYSFFGTGYVNTPHGIVCFDTWNFKHKKTKSVRKHTNLKIIINGVEYHRTYKDSYSERFIVTIASRFAKEIQLKQ